MKSLAEVVIQNLDLLRADQAIVLAVSGGPDSLCMLHILKGSNYPLIAAHLDHAIHRDSAAQAAAMRRVFEEWGIEYCIERSDVPEYARQHRLSLEEAAREVRYAFLFRQAAHHNAQAVCTAHTADDQVETVLMHLLRGAGLAGLRGMALNSLPNPWSHSISLLRPMLSIWRKDIQAYIQEEGLTPLDDPTNLDKKYYRNRIRHELIPYLDGYTPGIRQRLWQTAQLLDQDYEVIRTVLDQAWQRCLRSEGASHIAFDYQEIRGQPPAVQRHLFRQAAGLLLPGLRDVDYADLERASKFLAAPTKTRQIDWLKGLRVWLEAGRIWIAKWETPSPGHLTEMVPRMDEQVILLLPIPGILSLEAGWQIAAARVENAQSARQSVAHNTDLFQAWLCTDRLPGDLSVRTRRPGDRIQPLGMDGRSMKVSDLMINARLPVHQRKTWPLVAAGDQIAWIPGLRLAEPFRLTAESLAAVHLQLLQIA